MKKNTTNKVADETPFNAQLFAKNLEKAQSLWPQVIDKMSKISDSNPKNHSPLPHQISKAFFNFHEALLKDDPSSMVELGMQWWQKSMEVGQQQMQQFLEPDADGQSPNDKDRRFRSELWQSNRFYDNLKEQYKVTADMIDDYISKAPQMLQGRDAHLVEFYGKQWRDALSPSNYPWSNPEVLQRTMQSNGESLVTGLENLLVDLEQGRITMTPNNAFELGKNIATTKGSVVFENRLFQLIQYEATTKNVQKIPLLIIPAWINKYYILDLSEENSLVKWLCDQGFTVFIISWVNPDKSHHDITFDDYLKEGAWQASQVVQEICQTDKLHIAGYCLGGTLLASMLGWLNRKGKQDCVASASFLTTLVDFENAGDLKIFIDEEQIESLQVTLDERGYLEGNEMANIFNALRSKDLIWSFVINNYLLGKSPFPFDLLYWNGDVTRMPAKMHLFYLKQMYLENNLCKANALKLAGESIDLSLIKTPTYQLSAQEDHIAPWKATYAATQLFAGEKRFVLSGSGHIAGVVNPPKKHKYSWRENPQLTADAESWLEGAKQHDGSWWNDWKDWLLSHSSETIAARKIGSKANPAKESAPGKYATIRA